MKITSVYLTYETIPLITENLIINLCRFTEFKRRSRCLCLITTKGSPRLPAKYHQSLTIASIIYPLKLKYSTRLQLQSSTKSKKYSKNNTQLKDAEFTKILSEH